MLSRNLLKFMEYEQNTNYIPNKTCMKIKSDDPDFIYAPENKKWFQVKSYWVPKEEIIYKTATSYLCNFFNKENKILFIVHPLSTINLKDKEPGPIFNALATSSTRTLLVYPLDRPDFLFFAKTSIHKKDFYRVVNKNQVLYCIDANIVLDNSQLPINYFREVLSVYISEESKENNENNENENNENGSGGMVIREIPKDLLEDKIEIMPCFALYTKQKYSSIPLYNMIHISGLNSYDWINKYIIKPFVKKYLQLEINNGITFECHSQNLLIEIKNDQPYNFYFRDLDGLDFDNNYRKHINIFYIENPDEYLDKYEDLPIGSYSYFLNGIINGLSFDEIEKEKLVEMFKKTLQDELLLYGVRTYKIDDEYKILNESIKKIKNKKIKNVSAQRKKLQN